MKHFSATTAGVAIVALTGLGRFGPKMVESEDVVDLDAAMSNRVQVGAYPAERVSSGAGEIVSAYVRKDARGVLVSGAMRVRTDIV